ncbi:putative ribophorin I [Cyclospora cayetanensis]|uniref:Dolichyl-diphosphooligosaccharide--protein glycosyltransferase subunit 1 n=1 Tax=Cyclospora cayetanensis TaxID=88456 RepID=A0A1D3D074_9EIME|nr:putative ribophorin I [Cyclospora cayetanensis]
MEFYTGWESAAVSQLGWAGAATLEGVHLPVESVSKERPSIKSFLPADWTSRALLIEDVERHLVAASEGRAAFSSPCSSQVFRVKLAEPLGASQAVQVAISYHLGRPYQPLPQAVDLEFIQSVLFATSSNWPLPYPALRSSVAFRLPPQTTLGEAGEMRMQKKGFRKLEDGVWAWESQETIPPLAVVQPFALLFPLPLHLGYVVSMQRLVVVSVQGAMANEELFKIHNDAAYQKGAFNPISIALLQGLAPGTPRLALALEDVPRGKRVPSHVLFDLHAHLPADVYNLDVADIAGNLTSTFASRTVGPKNTPLSTHLEVWPRYPVLGGWNFDFVVKYNVPASSMQQNSPGSQTFSVRIPLEPPFPDVYTEDLSLTVALPTGATNVRYSSSIQFEAVEETQIKWWFDVLTTRPALTVRWHALSAAPSEGEKPFLVVTYDYFYPASLENLKELFVLVLVAAIAIAAFLLYSCKFRFGTSEEDMAAAGQQRACEHLVTDLGRIAEQALRAGQEYIDRMAVGRAKHRGELIHRDPSGAEEWRKAHYSREAAASAILETAALAESFKAGFKSALSRHHKAVQALVTAQPEGRGLQEAQREAESAAEQLLAYADRCSALPPKKPCNT